MSTVKGNKSTCPLCLSKGLRNVLKLYQINEEEAIYMCSDVQCPYPVGTCDPDLLTVKRSVPELKEKEEIVETSPEEQSEPSFSEQEKEDEFKTELDLMMENILAEEQDQ